MKITISGERGEGKSITLSQIREFLMEIGYLVGVTKVENGPVETMEIKRPKEVVTK